MIRERRYWGGGRLRYLLLLPMGIGLLGLWACAHSTKNLLAGAPLLGLLIYGCAVLIWGRIEVEVDAAGFRITPGPMPTGVFGEAQGKEAVRHLFPRYLRQLEGKHNWVDNYYAAVELTDGRWLNLRGPYRDWAGASAACLEVARLWGLREVGAGRQGFPAGYRHWRGAVVVLLWGVGFVAALLWGAWVEVSGWGR